PGSARREPIPAYTDRAMVARANDVYAAQYEYRYASAIIRCALPWNLSRSLVSATPPTLAIQGAPGVAD
ncbi:MAG TPA: hypothetical protein VIP11_01415, partial [Gemmatimonadaceae bacterium]